MEQIYARFKGTPEQLEQLKQFVEFPDASHDQEFLEELDRNENWQEVVQAILVESFRPLVSIIAALSGRDK